MEGRTLVVAGADVVDGSPVLDVKPYLPFCDSVPDALAPFWVWDRLHCTSLAWADISTAAHVAAWKWRLPCDSAHVLMSWGMHLLA